MQCSELELIEDFYDAGECTRLLHYFLKQHAWPDNQYEYGGRLFVLPRLQTWHADNEPELGESPCIASLSLGVTRAFSCRHNRTLNTESVLLSAGSLLIMYPGFQRYWQHSVPIEHGILYPRINLTFRKVIEPAVVAKSLN